MPKTKNICLQLVCFQLEWSLNSGPKLKILCMFSSEMQMDDNGYYYTHVTDEQ